MANYNYDEAGNMAAYFVLTFLLIFLIPYTLASFSTSSMLGPLGFWNWC